MPRQDRVDRQRAGLDEAGADALAAEFANVGAAPNLKAVTDHLDALKARYPKSDTVVFAPHDGLPYQSLVRILDATREKRLPGKDANGEPLTRTLFPVTVFSQTRTAPPEDESGEVKGAAMKLNRRRECIAQVVHVVARHVYDHSHLPDRQL